MSQGDATSYFIKRILVDLEYFSDRFYTDLSWSSILLVLSVVINTALDYSQWIWNIAVSFFPEYIDAYFLGWIVWLFTPIVVFFILPVVILCLLYFSALVLHLYRHRHRLRDAYANDFWDGAKSFLSTVWDGHGWIWHGYEVVGIDNIPEKGLLIYYHGTLPIDIYYLMAKYYLYKGKVIHAVGDRFLFKIPGLKLLFEVLKVTPGTVDDCVKTLNTDLLTISPGGLYEAQFGDNRYNLMWKDRIGFAKVALKAKVPIIPVFTQNVRESFRAINFGRNFFLRLYYKTRLPVVPIYGGFPVKMRTFIGEPILYDPNFTPEELVRKAAESIQKLISEHQRVPGSIFRALLDRF